MFGAFLWRDWVGLAVLDATFVHRRRHHNVGDLACSPGNYFDLGTHVVQDFSEEVPPCNVLVLGGGQVFQDCVTKAIFSAQNARNSVVWGVGISPKDRKSLQFDLLDANCTLVSTRNWGIKGCEYVPCASAMSPLFDTPPAPVHDVVLFFHARKSRDLRFDSGIPCRGNDTGTMAETIEFLASGSVIVTNSYHGTYWGMCLGRRVLCVPFSHKFMHFPSNPVQAEPQNWVEMIDHAETRPGLLEKARERNLKFYQKVRNLC